MSKLAICQEYCSLIQEMENIRQIGIPIYGLNQKRIELHEELCEAFKITREQCYGITDRLDEINYNPNILKQKLDKLSEVTND